MHLPRPLLVVICILICLLHRPASAAAAESVASASSWYQGVGRSLHGNGTRLLPPGRPIPAPHTSAPVPPAAAAAASPSPSSSSAAEGSLRLTGGSRPSEGNVEIMHLGRWGSVCDDEFDMAEGDVVCRSLGFRMGAHRVTSSGFFGPGKSTRTTAHKLTCTHSLP